MKLAILFLPQIERDKLMQTLLADKAKGDLGLIRACGLDSEVFDRQFLTVCISRDLRSTSVSLHKNEMEMLWSMNQLDALIESGSREPFHVRKAGTFDGDMEAARETAAKVMDEARREAGYRGETGEDLKKWLIETGRLPANCDDLMEPLIERQETPGRKDNTGAILMPDANELRTVLGEVSEALKDDDAVGIVVSIGPIDYFIAKKDSGLPGKVLVAVQEGSQVLGALYLKRNLDGMSGLLRPFQKHENDESAKKRLQGVLDKMLTDCAQTESERRPVRLGKFEKELLDQATRIENDREAKEAALNQPHHLLFFSAVDPDRVTRFFDILNQGDGFSLAETAVAAPRLGGCTETVYKSPSGGTHHVHRLYGKFPTDSAHRAMQDFAKHTGLTQVAEIAETLNLREAQPTWERIFQKLGCSAVTTGLASQEEKTKLTDERADYSVAAPSAEGAALRSKTGDTKQEPTDESSSGVTNESPGSQKLALTSQGERITGDVGPEFLAFIYEQMKIDPEWSVREERNLTWWGHRLAQRIWAETVIMEDGDEIVRVHAETDVLRNVSTAAHVTQSLSILNRNANLSAYVWNPETKKISLRSSAYFHSQNLPWLRVFFLSAVSLQAAEAHLQPDALAKLVGGEVDESAHPTNGFREQKDEMLDVIPLLYAPWGKNPSQFTREDFHTAMELDPKPWLMANEGEKGLTAEFRFPGCIPPTALLTVDNEIGHPLFGSGLFILLRLPLTLRGANVDSLASQLNLAELRNPTRTHFMGSWCVDSPRNVKLAQLGLLLMGESIPVGVLEKGAKETLSFCSFIPSVCHRPGLLENIVYSMGCRTMWANEYLASEEGVPAEFGPRHSGAFQEQSRQHLSLRKTLLDRALRHIKKKPN